MSAHFKPTAEQEKIIAAAKTGGSMVIEAGAGTGKTATLRLIAEALAPKRGLYLAYNKAIQVEAASSFPENVEARTAHSLAYREFGRKYSHRLNGPRTNVAQTAAILGIQPFNYEINGEKFSLEPRQLAVMVREALNKFYNSSDSEPNRYHIPFHGKRNGKTTKLQGMDQDALAAHLVPYVKKAWEDIQDTRGQLTFVHDAYLKMWSLSHPKLRYDFILFDEAQDANPAISAVVEHQDAQAIMVGDRAQAIYGWRGAVDAMTKFDADERLFLSQSFRFGPAVAEQANRWLNVVDTPLRITGFDKILSEVSALNEPDAILCRTNAGCIENAAHYQEAGYHTAIAGGTKEIEFWVSSASDLMDGRKAQHPDLAQFRSWDEVLMAVDAGEADDLRMMVRLVENYGVAAIIQICRNSENVKGSPSEWASKPGNIMISTAHKAKGLEWDRVRIGSDFQPPKDGGKINIAEAMLIYVAITRAKQHLDNGALAWFDEYEAEINEAMDDEEGAR